uniref:Dolichyl-diphosphooligosaccharide--protein glycosyltransferase subunit DAD1 n=1 Tax=Oryza punctata TaxID=4537 RepID=A0A0E0KPZ8_ORYPU
MISIPTTSHRHRRPRRHPLLLPPPHPRSPETKYFEDAERHERREASCSVPGQDLCCHTNKSQIIDLYVVFAVATALIQVVYMGIVGSFPFNSFLSVCLRIQVNKDNKEFKDLPPERAFADFVLCNLVLHLVIMNFLG